MVSPGSNVSSDGFLTSSQVLEQLDPIKPTAQGMESSARPPKVLSPAMLLLKALEEGGRPSVRATPGSKVSSDGDKK
ncbi:hypothetical protein XENTR_v10004516 [Xenopus tropicalis]|nr:hypothetical protein XENTR_v10004516 [Xenopus tropicalis]